MKSGRISKTIYALILSTALLMTSCGNIVDDVDESSKNQEVDIGNDTASAKNSSTVLISEISADENEEAQEVFKELEEINGKDLIVETNANGYITFLKGTIITEPIDSREVADATLKKILPALTSNKDINLTFQYGIIDDFGNKYINYSEEINGESISVNVVKFIVDKDFYMKGLSSSIVPYYEFDGEEIDEQKALEVVEEYLEKKYPDDNISITDYKPKKEYKNQQDSITLQEYCAKVYVVLTENPLADSDNESHPYMEHYVSLQGAYLGNASTYLTIDEDTERNLDLTKKWLSQDKETSYSLNYTDEDGYTYKATVPIGYDGESYFLECANRKIICADFYEYAYNKRIKVIESDNNQDWDTDIIIAYHNFVESYDYYADIGWNGPDGYGEEPILLLMDYQDINHNPIDNLSYLGCAEGIHLFAAYTRAKDYHKALDVVGHEYTHSVTNDILVDICYFNEAGAINEALSDIMGEDIELLHFEKNGIEVADKDTFCIAQSIGEPIRDLLVPELFGQPNQVGGEYYVPKVSLPSSMNDFGGVHINSSLISSIFPLMYNNLEVSLEQSSDFWLSIACMLVPLSGYKELRSMILVACDLDGMSDKKEPLKKIIDDIGLASSSPYDVVEKGKSQIVFTVPPWLDWTKVRIQVEDSNSGEIHVSWPAKGSNQIVTTVSGGRYKISLIQYDKDGSLTGGWSYEETGWIQGAADKGGDVEIPKGGKYILKEIQYNN